MPEAYQALPEQEHYIIIRDVPQSRIFLCNVAVHFEPGSPPPYAKNFCAYFDCGGGKPGSRLW